MTERIVRKLDADIINSLELEDYECQTAINNVVMSMSNGHGLDDAATKRQFERLIDHSMLYDAKKDNISFNVAANIVKEAGGTDSYSWNIDFNISKQTLEIEYTSGEWVDRTIAEIEIDPELAKKIHRINTCFNKYGEINIKLDEFGVYSKVPVDIVEDLTKRQVDAYREFTNYKNMLTEEVVNPYLEENGITNATTWNLNYTSAKITII